MKLNKLKERIEKEACAVQTDFETKLPKGYLDGQLFAFDLVLQWMDE